MLQLTLSCGTSFKPPLSVAYPFPIHFLVAFEKGANAAGTAVEKGKNAAEAVLEEGETATEAGHDLNAPHPHQGGGGFLYSHIIFHVQFVG